MRDFLLRVLPGCSYSLVITLGLAGARFEDQQNEVPRQLSSDRRKHCIVLLNTAKELEFCSNILGDLISEPSEDVLISLQRRFLMRSQAGLAIPGYSATAVRWGAFLLVIAGLTFPAFASSPDDKIIDQDSIAALQARILQAQPKEQCFLYAELIHQMTEFSMKQYAAGDVDKATDMLKQIQNLTHKLHLSMSENDKRLKNAEILLRHTAFRLTEFLHSSNSDDREVVQATLAQVNRAESETMMQVFRK